MSRDGWRLARSLPMRRICRRSLGAHSTISKCVLTFRFGANWAASCWHSDARRRFGDNASVSRPLSLDTYVTAPVLHKMSYANKYLIIKVFVRA